RRLCRGRRRESVPSPRRSRRRALLQRDKPLQTSERRCRAAQAHRIFLTVLFPDTHESSCNSLRQIDSLERASVADLYNPCHLWLEEWRMAMSEVVVTSLEN